MSAREPGSSIVGDGSQGGYTLGGRVGVGKFGDVRSAVDTSTGREVAIKLIPKGKMDPERLRQEIENHSAVSHRHVLQLLEAIEAPGEDALVLEYAPGGDLCEHLKARGAGLAEADAAALFGQLMSAVAHCHARSVAHRDIKLENIMLGASMEVKLGDFGLSASFGGEPLTDSVGSPSYAAPELLGEVCSYRGPEVDVWACGVVLYLLLCRRLPFDAPEYPQLFALIRRGSYRPPGRTSPAAGDLVRQMFAVDPEERISAPGVREHAWLGQHPLQGASFTQASLRELGCREPCSARRGPLVREG